MSRSGQTVSVSRVVKATPQAAFLAVADITNMGALSPETEHCAWVSADRGRGAKFTGTNQHGDRRWTTTCTVSDHDPGRLFSFEVRGPFLLSRWTFQFVEDVEGCRVTESWTDLRGRVLQRLSVRRSGIRDRSTHNRTSMTATLANLERLLNAQ